MKRLFLLLIAVGFALPAYASYNIGGVTSEIQTQLNLKAPLASPDIEIRITGATGAGTNYPVKITIGESSGATGANFNLATAAKVFPAGKNGTSSFIFWDSSNLVPFWVEKVTGTTPNRVAHIWVAPTIDLSSGTQTVFLTIDATDSVRSNGSAVFTLFDDFDSSSVDTAKWDTSVLSGQSIASGILSFGGGDTARRLRTLNTFGDGYEVISLLRASDTSASYSDFGWDSATAAEIFKYANGWNYASSVSVAGTLTQLTNNINNGVGTRQVMRIGRSGGTGRFTSENPSNTYTTASGVPTVANKVTVYSTYDNSTEIDWTVIKKYVATEPAFASVSMTADLFESNVNLTANRTVTSDANGNLSPSATTSTELGYLSGVTSSVQTGIDAKAPLASPTFTGTPAAPTATVGTNTTQLATTAFIATALSGRLPIIVDGTIDANSTALVDNALYVSSNTQSLTNGATSAWAWALLNIHVGSWTRIQYLFLGNGIRYRTVDGTFTGATWTIQ